MRAFTCIAILFGIGAIVAGFFGFMFLIATVGDLAANQMTAFLLLGAAGVMIVVAIILGYIGLRTPQRVVVQAQVDLPRDFDVSQVNCPHCGGTPSRDNLAYDPRIGAVILTCPYCSKVSQLVEDVKW
ncbi:MAG: hypothetical protein ACXADB_02280 [Candidatus Hermodarchaeia archaeon]|jgi:hypothetical protein